MTIKRVEGVEVRQYALTLILIRVFFDMMVLKLVVTCHTSWNDIKCSFVPHDKRSVRAFCDKNRCLDQYLPKLIFTAATV
jgi:hypothetical protein